MRSVMKYAAVAAWMSALAGAQVARAQDGDVMNVQAQGSAQVVGNDTVGAKGKATKDALRNALEQGLGAQVSSVSVVKDYQLVKDAVTSSVDGFVKEYKVLEEKNEGGVYTVKVDAKISKAAAMDAFSLALLEAGRPKVAFVIAERMAGQTDFATGNQERGKTENLLVEYFLARGLTVVDLGGLTGINLNGANASGELSAADAEKIAEKADAQYVVIGKVVGVDAGPIMIQGLRSYNMSLSLKMFSTSTHEIVAAVTKSNAIPCISPNLAPVSCSSAYKARVVDVAAQDLLEKTSKSFVKSNISGSKRVQVLVTVANFGALAKFVKALPDDVKGVGSVQQRSFKANKAVLDIELEGGDVNYLASELSSKKVGGAVIEVMGVNTDKLEIEIKK